MTLFIENRIQMRTQCQAPLGLACVACRTGEAFLATVHNISEEGLYLETYFGLDIDDNILIHPRIHLPKGITRRLLDENVGIVRWAKPVMRGEHYFRGAGVKLLIN
ncbi:MAG TPA: hypothetical protein PLA83_07600 [Deltaproteobacteria bacterium]|jgi:hypothetical protein|nr:hypothetical protein [Deltaproteobacteria bacterium]HQI00157.1 hypothetical protein [Deltaproteobacteria bacterium]HQJ07447.1 hypothetical protein [Deltaproteobacteria bacterium]